MPSTAVLATAAQLTAQPYLSKYGVQLVSDPENAPSEYVFVGFSSAVTAGSAAATDGIPLGPGVAYLVQPVMLANGLASDIYVIGSTTGLKVYWQPVNLPGALQS